MHLNIPKELYEKADAGNLVIFVGAGCSVGAGYPDWKSLVDRVIDVCSDYVPGVSGFKEPLREGLISPIEVLDKLESKKRKVYPAIEEIFSELEVAPTKVHEKIWDVSSKVITTNYDSLLEGGMPERIKVINSLSDYQLSKLRDSDSYLFKAHGDLSALDHALLFSNDYNHSYSPEGMLRAELSRILSTNSILFLGFSNSDPYFSSVFEFVSSVYGSYSFPHFMISTDSSPVSGVEKIIVDDYQEIVAILDLLADSSRKKDVGAASGEQECYDEGKKEIELNRDGVDIPPDVPMFVGRETEIKALHSGLSKVYCISGIGGVGKSALASMALFNLNESYHSAFWRDFKEEGHNFVAKISSIISELKGIDYSDLAGLNESEIIDELFSALGEFSCLVVLDNVDSYVEVPGFVFGGAIGQLLDEAEKRVHKSCFVVTCRPFIKHASPEFHQFVLKDLSQSEVYELVERSNVNISGEKLINVVEGIYEVTHGHALWTSLLVKQCGRGFDAFSSLLVDIKKKGVDTEEDFSIAAERCLGSLWVTLNKNHQTLLRVLCESPGSNSIDDLEGIVRPEMNYNRFVKALATLRRFGLVIEKSDGRYIELHPLVRKFVRDRFPSGESRNKYIGLFVDYLGGLMYVLRPKIKLGLSFEEFEMWTNKISLNLERNKTAEAYADLSEIMLPMKNSGHIEHLVKIVLELLDNVSWVSSSMKKLGGFESGLKEMLGVLAEYGEFDKAEYFLDKYASSVSKKEERYIRVLSIKSYILWVKRDFEAAISVGEEAEYLIDLRSLSEDYGVKQYLALSRRDGGKDGDRALAFFTRGYSLDDLCKVSKPSGDVAAETYGNVGRCLSIMGRLDEAKICYAKSLSLLLNSESSDKVLNLGFAASWVSDALPHQSKYRSWFNEYVTRMWHRSSPPLLNRFRRDNGVTLDEEISSLEDWQVEKVCKEWASEQLNAA